VSVAEQTQGETKQSRRRSIWLLIALALIVALVAMLAFGLRPDTSTKLEGQKAPNFELTAFNGEFDGQHFSLEDLHGQPVVLNFWASWCVECDKEMALLEQAWHDYQDQGIWFIGVDYLDIDSEGLAYLDRYGITYPNAPDIGSRAFEDYQCTGVPETFFIDRDGVIQHVQIGPLTQPRLYALLDQLVAAETPN
jgi:cytochrome c biogenesis protein CcmG/thiol:disulfide interchange protein DsbE